jgi:hypothetical protein
MNIFRKISNVNWVAGVLFPVAVILTDIMWVYPWMTHIGRWPVFAEGRTPLNLASLIFLLGFSFLLTRVMTGRDWPESRKRLAMVSGCLLAVLIVTRVEYSDGFGIFDPRWFVHVGRLVIGGYSHLSPICLAIPSALLLWLRGVGLGRSNLFFENIYRYFTIGLIALIVLIISWSRDTQTLTMSSTGIYIVGFFSFGLSSLALAKLKGTQEREKKEEGKAVFNGRWLSIIIIVIACIVLAGIGIASIFSTQFLSVIGVLFNILSGVLFKLFYYISVVLLSIVGAALAISFAVVQFIINLLSGEPVSNVNPLSGNATVPEQLKQSISRTASPEIMTVVTWALVILVLGIIIFFLVRAMMKFGSSMKKEDVDETSESLWSWNGFLADVRVFFNLITGGLKSRLKNVNPAAMIARRHPHSRREITGRMNIREIYRELLFEGARSGITRRYQETPNEYGKRLGQAFPEGEKPLSEITDMYIKTRYGDTGTDTGELDHANTLWQKIRSLLVKPEEDE